MAPGKLKPLLPFLLLLILISPALAQPKTTATVISVTDGDTLKIEIQGRKEPIRLIGIDCPESRKNAKAKRGADSFRREKKG